MKGYKRGFLTLFLLFEVIDVLSVTPVSSMSVCIVGPKGRVSRPLEGESETLGKEKGDHSAGDED